MDDVRAARVRLFSGIQVYIPHMGSVGLAALKLAYCGWLAESCWCSVVGSR